MGFNFNVLATITVVNITAGLAVYIICLAVGVIVESITRNEDDTL